VSPPSDCAPERNESVMKSPRLGLVIIAMLSAVTTIGVVPAPAVAAASPRSLVVAGPAGCMAGWLYYHVNPAGNSSNAWATGNCDGIYAASAQRKTDSVRGQYYRDGAWRQSSYGFRRVTVALMNSPAKIIGNTTDGRRFRGEGYSVSQEILTYW
jgi:hypothetical protein